MTQPETGVLDQFGPVVRQEFEASDERYHAQLRRWLAALLTVSDVDLREACEWWIYKSASIARLGGNWNHIHIKATACYKEAERRKVAAGHGEDCHGPTIYSRAHATVMRRNGHTPSPHGTCECDLPDGAR